MKRGDLVQDMHGSWVGIVLRKKEDGLYRHGGGSQVWWVMFQNTQIIDVSESTIRVIS